MIQISLRVLFKPDPKELPFIYRRLGRGGQYLPELLRYFQSGHYWFLVVLSPKINYSNALPFTNANLDYEERVLPSIVNEVTKAVVAQYNASELLTKRDAVSKQIREMLNKRAGDFKILLDDVSITHLAFSKEYTAAVEAKQVAQQDSERAKYIVERAIQEKRTIVIRAEGEAKSAMLIGAVRNIPVTLICLLIHDCSRLSSPILEVFLVALVDSIVHLMIDTDQRALQSYYSIELSQFWGWSTVTYHTIIPLL